ncbi:MAG: carboxypeptidase-like regulatory domain-containing protein [Longimicrobiales bacterium]
MKIPALPVFIALGASLAAAPSAQAQLQNDTTALFTFSGEVADASNGRPIIAAVIKVPELQRLVYSQVDGTFEFEDFPAGTWTFVIEQLGYHTSNGQVTVADGNEMSVRLRPDPVALAGFRVRSRSQQLITDRARKIPYHVRTLGPEVFTDRVNSDPAYLLRTTAGVPITTCGNTSEDSVVPACFTRKGRRSRLAVFMDEGKLMGGMEELSMYDARHIHSMEVILGLGMVRVYTHRFVERLDNSRISLEPLVY